MPLALALLGAVPGQSQQPRPLTVPDLFTFEQLGHVVASPDGEWLAVVIARPRSQSEIYRDFSWGPPDADHADIWLIPTRAGERRNITNGGADGSGYWSPVWSPDGKRLALLSTKGGDDIRPYVWEMASGALRRLTDQGFDMEASGDVGWPAAPLIWANDTTLICPLRPIGAPPTYYSMSKTRSMGVAAAAWQGVASGRVITVSVLNSGKAGEDARGPVGQVVAFNVATGNRRVVEEGNSLSLMLSPTRRHLALITRERSRRPSPGRKLLAYRGLTEEWWHTRLAIVPLTEHSEAAWVSDEVEPIVGRLSFLGEHPGTWSPDGSLFAAVVKDSASDSTVTTILVINPVSATARTLEDLTLEVQRTAWRGGELLAMARRRRPEHTMDSRRWDWWLIDPGSMRPVRNLTAGLPATDSHIMPLAHRHGVVTLAGGELWTIDTRTGVSTNVTANLREEVEAIVWPAASERRQMQSTAIVKTNRGTLYRIECPGMARIDALRTPAGGELVDFRPKQSLAVFTGAASNGVFLWTGDISTGRFTRRLELNPQLAGIADVRRLLIHYRGLDGDSLTGVVLLPAGYTAGRRYPLVSWVYPATMVSDTVGPSIPTKHDVSALNLNPLAARGYAVLIPSMPMRREGPPGEPYLDLPKGVMPAVDKVIELGIADPRRLAVMGHSHGGYATYSLVSYSNRFKAAVALAAPADWMSLYGAVPPTLRYAQHPQDEFFFAALSESGQGGMGGPPWEDAARYLRNSPYYYVDRIETPLMLIHGDMDYVPMQQSEHLFTALRRLGKRARLVRYWGEGHIVSSPANILDMWQRIFAWLDEHLEVK